MKKRGDFTDHALSIIIAIVVLAVIVIAAGRLYVINNNQESENARATLDSLVARIDAFEDESGANITIQGFRGARNWVIVGWDLSNPNRPERCLSSSCLCVCADDGGLNCNEEGFCRLVDFSSVNVSVPSYEIVSASSGGTGGVSFSHGRVVRACVPLRENLLEVEVHKSSSGIIIRSDLAFYESRTNNVISSDASSCLLVE